MTHASLFSGFGAPDLAATWMGWDNAFWCETDDFCRQILKYWFPKSKGYGNIKETDFTEWRGKIDILTGGFPCQPFSVAGQRKGTADDRYLWPEMLRAIREIRPAWVIGENVNGILSMVQPGCEVTVESQASLFEETHEETLLEEEYVVETVCRDIEKEGYSVQPVVIPACAVGAPHRRDRVFFIANCTDARIEGLRPEWENTIYGFETLAYSNSYDARRSRYGKTGYQTGSCQESQRQWERLRGDVKRDGKKGLLPTPTTSMVTYQDFVQAGYHSSKRPEYSEIEETGETSQLNPLYIEEMMGFPSMWCALPFLSLPGEPDQSKDTETQSFPK